jgi:hypothetical protein
MEQVPGWANAMTNELCQSTCLADGFSIAGTEYAGECCRIYASVIFSLAGDF